MASSSSFRESVQKRNYTLIKGAAESQITDLPVSQETQSKWSWSGLWTSSKASLENAGLEDVIMVVGAIVLFCVAASLVAGVVLYVRDTKDEIMCHPVTYMSRHYNVKDAIINASAAASLIAFSMEMDFSLASFKSQRAPRAPLSLEAAGSPLGACRTFCQRAFNIADYRCQDSEHCRMCQIPVSTHGDINTIAGSPYSACIAACAGCAESKCTKRTEPFLKGAACGFDCKSFSSAWIWPDASIKCT